MTNMHRTILTVAGLGLACSNMALAQFSQWEDHAIGAAFLDGDSTLSDDVLVEFSPIQYPSGHTHANRAEVRGEDTPCNNFNRLELIVMTAKFCMAFALCLSLATSCAKCARNSSWLALTSTSSATMKS